MVERRTLSGPAEQTVASTSLGFEIRPSTTVFRFRRLPADGPAPAPALRNGPNRDPVEPARRPVPRKSVEEGKRVSVRIDLGGRRILKKHTRTLNSQATKKTHPQD